MEEMTILTWLALLLFYLVIKDSKFLFEDDIEYLTLSNGTLMFKSWLILNYARLFSFFKNSLCLCGYYGWEGIFRPTPALAAF